MDEMKLTLASIFKRAGRQALSENELYLALSIDLKWFIPSEAKSLVNLAIKNNLLISTPEGLKPGFDISGIDVPLGFRPGREVLEYAPEDTFKEIVMAISKKIQKDAGSVAAEIDKEVKAFNGLIDPRVAAAIVASRHGISEYASRVEKIILKEYSRSIP